MQNNYYAKHYLRAKNYLNVFHGEIFNIINCIQKMVEVIFDIRLSYLSIKLCKIITLKPVKKITIKLDQASEGILKTVSRTLA